MQYVITLQESGYKMAVDFDELARYGDDPFDYSDDPEDFVFFSKDFSIQTGMFSEDDLVDWPEYLPVWEYRPC